MGRKGRYYLIVDIKNTHVVAYSWGKWSENDSISVGRSVLSIPKAVGKRVRFYGPSKCNFCLPPPAMFNARPHHLLHRVHDTQISKE